jgi:hypothetical protein
MALASSMGAQAAAPANDSPDRAAYAFWDVYEDIRPSALPEDDDIHRLAPFVTPSLAAAMVHARQVVDARAEASSDEDEDDAPAVGGDLFVSSTKGADGFNVGRCTGDTRIAECIVEFHGSGVAWRDRTILRETRDGWKVDDLAYDAPWALVRSRTLRARLDEVTHGDVAQRRFERQLYRETSEDPGNK